MKIKGGLIKQDAIAEYNKFMQSGRLLDKSEHPYLDKQDFTALVKFLLPIFAPNEVITLSCSSKITSKRRLERLNTEEGILWEEVTQQAISKEGVHM